MDISLIKISSQTHRIKIDNKQPACLARINYKGPEKLFPLAHFTYTLSLSWAGGSR